MKGETNQSPGPDEPAFKNSTSKLSERGEEQCRDQRTAVRGSLGDPGEGKDGGNQIAKSYTAFQRGGQGKGTPTARRLSTGGGIKVVSQKSI